MENWIKVSDRLPPEGKFRMSAEVLTLAGKKMRVKLYDHKLGQWDGSPQVTITHWMPLPEPPKD